MMYGIVYVLTDNFGTLVGVCEDLDAALRMADIEWRKTKGDADAPLVWHYRDEDRSLSEVGGVFDIQRRRVEEWYDLGSREADGNA